MRTLSQAIKNVLAQDYAETRDVVIITIPEQQGATVYPETILYLGNGEGIYLDGHNYDDRLRYISSIKFSLGKAPDNAEIAIENVSRELGFPLADFQRALDGAKVEIKRAFKVDDLTWESNTMFVGYVRDVHVDQEKITLAINSDMSQRGTSVAGRPLTQRCILKFNVNGSGVGPICGWLTTQPGNALSCDKGLETPNGCQSHGNQHRFGGVPAFTALEGSNGYDYSGGGWGEGSGGGWCIDPNSYVLSSVEGKRMWIPARQLIAGLHLISIDPEGRFVPAKITSIHLGFAEGLTTLVTSKGFKLTCSKEHGVMQKYNTGDAVPTEVLVVGDEVLVYDYKQHIHYKDTIDTITTSTPRMEVLKISLESPNNLYIAGGTEEGAIVSHNTKPIWTTQGSGGYPEGWYNNF
jgi:hypothetical protein